MTPFPPCSSKYLIYISSGILTTVQPESVGSKYNPLDTQGLESVWKSNVPLTCMLNALPEYLCTDWKSLSNLYVASYLLLGIFSIEKRENKNKRASLVAQWLRICLLMQGTRVRALVWEDPTCRRAAGPVSRNY